MKTQVLNEPAPIPGRQNEDTCGVYSDGAIISLFVADGAGQRMKTTKTQTLFEQFGAGTSSARFAALMIHEIFAGWHSHSRPQDILMEANAGIRDNMIRVYGDLTPEALRAHEPQLAPYLNEDPRLFRMALPACVATAAEINLNARTLDYAHAGDTALLLFHEDGRVIEVTQDLVEQHDAAALRLARQIQIERGAAHLAHVLDDPRVIDANWRSGLYHNYVDAQGRINLQQGFGILNGLPELELYLQRGTVNLTGVRGVVVCSDGFFWPAPLDENSDSRQARLRHMRDSIEIVELSGYFAALRAAERADSPRDLYPRFKIHDDCTAVYIKL